MDRPLKILVQTTIPRRSDDWSIDSLALMRCELAAINEAGVRVDVVARDRTPDPTTPDPVLSRLDESDFDELWLFALDAGEGLTAADCSGITRFRQRGGGILSTRDHQDMGSSLCTLGGIGSAHHFQTKNPEPERERRAPTTPRRPPSPGPTTTRATTVTSRRSRPSSPCTSYCATRTRGREASSTSRLILMRGPSPRLPVMRAPA